MNINLALTGALPGLLAMWYVDRLDAKRPEPAGTRRLAAFLGALSVLPALALGTSLEAAVGNRLGPSYTYEGALYTAFLRAAAVEELCKIAVVYWLIWRREEFDERMDGIVYATRAGLGFAIVENFFYLLKEQAFDSFLTTWVLRALLAVPGHAMWTGMIGAYGARRRFDGRGIGLLGGYLLAVLFHGAYDAFLFCNVPLTLEGREDIALVFLAGPVLLTIAAALLMRRLSKTAAHLDDLDALRKGPPAPPPMPYPPQGAYPYPPQGAYPYPPQGAYPYPPQGAYPHPPQGAYPHPPQGAYPYPPQGAYPHPPQGAYPYPPQGAYPYPPQGAYPPPSAQGGPPSPYAPPGAYPQGPPSPYAPPGAYPPGAPSPYAPPGAKQPGAPSPHAPPGANPPGAPSPHATPGANPPGGPPPQAPAGAPPPGAPSPYAPPGAARPPHAPQPYAPPGSIPQAGPPPHGAPTPGAPTAPSPWAPPGRPPGGRDGSQ